jgi:type IV secretion system protein VirB5
MPQVKWTESRFERGSPAGRSRWTAILTVLIKPPSSAEALRKKPLGLYVDAIDWSRELDLPPDPQSGHGSNRPPAPQPAPPPAEPAGAPSLPLGSPLDPGLGAISSAPAERIQL